jgi:hypothetical protein
VTPCIPNSTTEEMPERLNNFVLHSEVDGYIFVQHLGCQLVNPPYYCFLAWPEKSFNKRYVLYFSSLLLNTGSSFISFRDEMLVRISPTLFIFFLSPPSLGPYCS